MKNKKFGLITLHDTLNYGSLLQTYALYRKMRELGADIELIDYQCPLIQKKEAVIRLDWHLGVKGILKYFVLHGQMQKKKDNFWAFIRNHMTVSREFTPETIEQANQSYDAFLVGSDIVWGTEVTGNDLNYFLEFAAHEKKKYAFSPSVGKKWKPEEYGVISALLQRFHMISVREALTSEWIREIAQMSVPVSCDPTMLLTRDEWNQLCDDQFVPKGKYVLVYLKMEDESNIVDAIAYGKKNNLPVYYVNFGRPVPGTRTIQPTSIEEWIALIKHAEIVFTASYHGLLFSMYFHRQFYYYNRGNKARMESFGREMEIEYREGTEENISRSMVIDYQKIDGIMEEKRKTSTGYLKDILQDA